MIYNDIFKGIFIERPNRFIAHVEVLGKREICHVKNTGRCAELLVPGTEVYVQKSHNPKRTTGFSLISVNKGGRLINMDSQAPNKIFMEYIKAGRFLDNISVIKPEYKYEKSRLDFYLQAEERQILCEVKGVTLEEKGVCRFPDAPTLRGLRHVNELAESVLQGYEAFLIFIIQMKNVKHFAPNDETQPEFGVALRNAQRCGVKLLAIDCVVTENSITAADQVPIKLK